jgi:hypothetical protein
MVKLANLTLLLTIILTLGAGIGQASLVAPGGNTLNDLFSASQEVTLLASITGPWGVASGGAADSGTLTDAVFLNNRGTLDFAYQFTNASSSMVGITETTAYNYGNFLTDVGYVKNGAALPGAKFVTGTTSTGGIPSIISRSPDGSTISFQFNASVAANIKPGVTTAVLLISTNATRYADAGIGIIASGTDNLEGFEPLHSTVPEPGFLLPMGLILVLGAFISMRRQRTAN